MSARRKIPRAPLQPVSHVLRSMESITGYTYMFRLLLACGHERVVRVRAPMEGEVQAPSAVACHRACETPK